jgi:hypothetical protein
MGRKLWRGEPQEGIDGRSARVGDRTSPCREESPEANRVLVCTSRCGARAGNDRRAGPPRGGTAAHGEEALKGEAHGRSGASRAGRCDGVAAQEVAKPPHVAGGSRVEPRSSRAIAPRVCRRASKAQERLHGSTSRSTGRRDRAGLRRTPLKGQESVGRARARLRLRGRSHRGEPDGRRNAGRAGWNP